MSGFVPALLASDIADELSLVHLSDPSALLTGDCEALLDGIEEDPAKFLSIVLFKTLSGLPSKTFRKALGIYGSFP